MIRYNDEQAASKLIRVPDRFQPSKASPPALLLMQLRTKAGQSKAALDATIATVLPVRPLARKA